MLIRVCNTSLSAKITEDLLGRTTPTSNRAMYGSIVSSYIGGFAGKKKSIFDRARQSLLRTIGAYAGVTVSPARKRIVLPIVKVSIIEQVREFFKTDVEQAAKRLQTSINNKGATPAG